MARLSASHCQHPYTVTDVSLIFYLLQVSLANGKAANLVVTFTVCFCLIVLNLMSRFFPLVAFNIWEF